MARRSKRSQSQHDRKVRQIARDFEKNGFDVKADVQGFSRPDTIGGYRPDVVATKGRERKIVEVETTESKDSTRDRNQKKAFRKAANRSKYTTFTRRIVDTES